MSHFSFTQKHSRSKGVYTEVLIERASHIVERFTQHLSEMFLSNKPQCTSYKYVSKKHLYTTEVHKFVDTCRADALLTCHPGRSHRCFKDYQQIPVLPNKNTLKGGLLSHSSILEPFSDEHNDEVTDAEPDSDVASEADTDQENEAQVASSDE